MNNEYKVFNVVGWLSEFLVREWWFFSCVIWDIFFIKLSVCFDEDIVIFIGYEYCYFGYFINFFIWI